MYLNNITNGTIIELTRLIFKERNNSSHQRKVPFNNVISEIHTTNIFIQIRQSIEHLLESNLNQFQGFSILII